MGKGGFHGAGCGGKARNFYCLGKKVVVHGRRSSRGPPARTFVGYFVCRFVVCPGCACPRSCGRVARGPSERPGPLLLLTTRAELGGSAAAAT